MVTDELLARLEFSGEFALGWGARFWGLLGDRTEYHQSHV
jgi:hypothetical protein